ncbi:hypothetical protein wTpre_106 [Wolbachia endosymbiont of Trichogramma pretiosum]|nr:hypothetical protein wTpre_106 [Wolbachia endosymbiont of Trichogramma pretiosum]
MRNLLSKKFGSTIYKDNKKISNTERDLTVSLFSINLNYT